MTWLVPRPSRPSPIFSIAVATMMRRVSATVHPVAVTIPATKSGIRSFESTHAHSAAFGRRWEGSLSIMEFPTIQFVAVLKARNILWSCGVRLGLEVRVF